MVVVSIVAAVVVVVVMMAVMVGGDVGGRSCDGVRRCHNTNGVGDRSDDGGTYSGGVYGSDGNCTDAITLNTTTNIYCTNIKINPVITNMPTTIARTTTVTLPPPP
jgi:hypothetical protein